METKKVFTISDLMAAIANNAARQELDGHEEARWAMSSNFYAQVMEDGHIFNPYLHRRFVPSQFLRLLKYNGMDARQGINNNYGYMYAIEWVKEEVRKLAFLQTADPIAFNERQNFLTIDDVRSIISDYVVAVTQYVSARMQTWNSIRIDKYTFIRSREDKENFISQLHKFHDGIQSAITYETLNELLKDHYVINIYYGIQKPSAFVEAFARGGAYYTLKHLVMFEHLSLNGKTGADACAELTRYLYRPADEVCEVLKMTISANKYTF